MAAELPFMATEAILMHCVKAGGDRQALHEAVRVHSMEAGRRVKEQGCPNDLLKRVAGNSCMHCLTHYHCLIHYCYLTHSLR